MKPSVAKAPLPATPSTDSFFKSQVWHRRSAACWALLIESLSGLMAGSVAFLLVLVVLLYVTFVSRLLPTRVGSMWASVLDLIGGLLGAGLVALLLTAVGAYFVRRMFKRDTTMGLLERVGARAVNLDDEQELGLVRLIEETAAAAGMPVPSVLLFDGPSLNAAAMGDRPSRAGLLIARETLNVLEPEKLRGVIGHLLAAIANGDLRITDAVLRGLGLMGWVTTLLDVPFSGRARRSLSMLTRHAFPSPHRTEPPSSEIASAMVRTMHPDVLESLTIFLRQLVGEENDVRSIAITVLSILLLPILLVRLMAGVIYCVASLLLFGPTVTLILRRRRISADAAGVRLTRDAAGLSAALEQLYGTDRQQSHVGWSEMSFVVGAEPANAAVFERLQSRARDLLAEVNSYSARLRVKRPSGATRDEGTAGDEISVMNHDFVFGFHPRLSARLDQLQRLGATPSIAIPHRDASTWIISGVLLIGVGCVLVFALPALRR